MKVISVGGDIGGRGTALMLHACRAVCEPLAYANAIRKRGAGVNTLRHTIKAASPFGHPAERGQADAPAPPIFRSDLTAMQRGQP